MSSFLAALIPLGLSMITGGGQPQQKAKGDGMNLAESFLFSSGLLDKDKKLTQGPFSTPEIPRARSIGEMRLGSSQSG